MFQSSSAPVCFYLCLVVSYRTNRVFTNVLVPIWLQHSGAPHAGGRTRGSPMSYTLRWKQVHMFRFLLACWSGWTRGSAPFPDLHLEVVWLLWGPWWNPDTKQEECRAEKHEGCNEKRRFLCFSLSVNICTAWWQMPAALLSSGWWMLQIMTVYVSAAIQAVAVLHLSADWLLTGSSPSMEKNRGEDRKHMLTKCWSTASLHVCGVLIALWSTTVFDQPAHMLMCVQVVSSVFIKTWARNPLCFCTPDQHLCIEEKFQGD